MTDSLVIIIASEDMTLHTATLDGASGRLSGLAATPLPEVQGPNGASPLAVSPDGHMLYVAFRGTPPAVLSFRIDHAARRLAYAGRAPLVDSMAHISTDASGRWLFSASYSGGRLALNTIGADGVAGDIREVLDIGPKAHCTVPGPGNRLFVVSLGTDAILRYAFDAASGRLEALQPAARTPAGTGPRHLVFDRSGHFAYVVNELSGTVDAYAVDAEGLFTRLQSLAITADGFTGKPQAADIHLTANGRLLFASERASNTLAGFTVDPESGRLQAAGKTTAPPTPRGFAIAPEGNRLLVLGEQSANATLYAIDAATGGLTQIEEVATGKGPNWVEILPLQA